MKKITLITLSICIFSLISSCGDNPKNNVDCTGITATYSGQIKAIMDSNCALSGCHTSQSPQSGYALDTYSGTSAGASNSNFLCSINWDNGCQKMPQGGSKLSDGDIQLLSCWVQDGKPQ